MLDPVIRGRWSLGIWILVVTIWIARIWWWVTRRRWITGRRRVTGGWWVTNDRRMRGSRRRNGGIVGVGGLTRVISLGLIILVGKRRHGGFLSLSVSVIFSKKNGGRESVWGKRKENM